MKKNLHNILLSVLVVLLFLLIMEFILSVYYSVNFSSAKFETINKDTNTLTISSIVPNTTIPNYIYNTTLNSEGFRDNNYYLETNKTRIIILGDSFTFGKGIQNYNSTYPKILESNLNQESDKYEVMNFAMPGFNILDIYWVLKYKVLKYNPDIVVYAFYNNDVEFLKNINPIILDNIDIEFCKLLDNKSYYLLMYDFHKIRSNNLIRKMHMGKQYDGTPELLELYEDNFYGWRCVKNVVRKFKELSSQSNFTFVVFTIPANTHPNNQSLIIQDKVYDLFLQHNMTVIKEFAQKFWSKTEFYNDEDLRVNVKDERHYNKKAHTIIAQLVYDYFKK